VLLSAWVLLLAAPGCGTSPPSAPVAAVNATASTELSVQGMTCESCAVAIRTALAGAPGVGEVTVDVEGGRATVKYDPARAKPEQIAATITGLGYPTTVGTSATPAAPSAATSSEPFGPDPAITAICQAGCAAQVDYEESDVVAQPGAKAGDLTRCPVSGVVFFVQPDQSHVEVNGQTWYTCCAMCAGKLTENPQRFVRG
jgi:mercuric ion binding protein